MHISDGYVAMTHMRNGLLVQHNVSTGAAHLSPSSRPGPRNDDTLVRLALSKLALNTSRMPNESVTALIWGRSDNTLIQWLTKVRACICPGIFVDAQSWMLSTF